MLTVAFYTEGTPYQEEAGRLEKSLSRVGMDSIVESIPAGDDDPPGSRWYSATAHKPQFVRRMRKEHRGPLLYLDVDAIVHKNCDKYFENIDADFACHYFQGPAGGYNPKRNDNRLLSGTLWFADSPSAKDLLDTWCDLNKLLVQQACMAGGGQKNLWFLTTCLGWLRIHKLPGRYCYVYDKPWAYPDGEPRIIEHLICSRENRDKPHTPRADKIARVAGIEASWINKCEAKND